MNTNKTGHPTKAFEKALGVCRTCPSVEAKTCLPTDSSGKAALNLTELRARISEKRRFCLEQPVESAKNQRTNAKPDRLLATRPVDKYILRLFVAGATARSHTALLSVRKLCETELNGDYDLEVIDIYQQPNLARANQIVATPTLIREFPLPARRFIGNLLNTAGLFVALNVLTKSNLPV